jgi:hypothetical protein
MQVDLKEEKMKRLLVRLLCLNGLGVIVLLSLAFAQSSMEQMEITTYYPSPYGSYNELTAKRVKIGTTYSQSTTTVADDNLLVEGKVRIGTTDQSAASKLVVSGNTDSSTYSANGTSGVSSTLTVIKSVGPPATTCTITITGGIVTASSC